jgi:para-aminobenzoate synthetase/4-amino-4-deoxychorismate lyase
MTAGVSAGAPPTALVDGVDLDGRLRTWTLGCPRDSWAALQLGEVLDALARVEEAQAEGLTVVGAIVYEAAAAFDQKLATHDPAPGAPLAWFAAYDGFLSSLARSLNGGAVQALRPRPREQRDSFVSGVRGILARIADGEVYQVNLTLQADVQLPGDSVHDAWPLHLALRRATRAPHAAYLGWGAQRVLSLSPELFLRRRGRVIESAPMKGTAARGRDRVRDAAMGRWLSRDPKTRAENVMIVDLMRNDLGRVCRHGSIGVPALWTVTAHPTVFQMTSLVRGELRPGVSLTDILAATFPPGSVTGAPKVRAMEIIREIEAEPRGLYCGTLGIFHPGGDFDLSVAIRTLEVPADGPARLGLGAGIVADSDPHAEWEETLLKGRFLS